MTSIKINDLYSDNTIYSEIEENDVRNIYGGGCSATHNSDGSTFYDLSDCTLLKLRQFLNP